MANQAGSERRNFLPLLVIAVALIAGLSAAATYFYMQTQARDEQLAAMSQQLTEVTDRMETISKRAETAANRAISADQSAQLAAEGRSRAEDAQAEAESQATVARAEAQTAAEQAEAASREAETLRQEREQTMNRLQEALGALVETRRTAMGLVMNLGSDAIEFDFDQATLRPANRELLSRIAGILLTATGYSMYVYGHTDDVGSDQYNRDLSERRAQTVRDYLVEAGLNSGIITIRGYGKTSPMVAGTTPEARARNRRVEIGIVDVALDYRGPDRRF